VFLGNGLMAILAGFIGDFLVERMDLGRVAPFDAAIVFMLIGGAVMIATWPENYGDSGSKNLGQQFEKAWHAITTGEGCDTCPASFTFGCSQVVRQWILVLVGCEVQCGWWCAGGEG
jgi:hypothetical protein